MHHFIIDTHQSGIWFSLIYLFTFFMVNGVFIYKGVKDQHSLVSLWIIALTGMLFFIAGLNLFPLSLNEIKLFILNDKLSNPGEKSLLGGILGLGGLLLAVYWLKEKFAIIDNMAIAFIVGVGIQNIACFKAGCCFGNQSTDPWAIQYDKLSPAFGNQLKQGIVQLTDSVTTPLHPVQLYLLFGCLLIAFIVWKTKNRWHAPLSLLVVGWLLYTILRFAVEFLRDPATNHGAGYIIYGLKAIQWYLIAMMVISGLILYFRERKFRFHMENSIMRETGLGREISLLLFIMLISWLFRGLFGYTEKLLLNSFQLIAVFLVGWKVFKAYTLRQYRLATLLCILGSCILLSQSYIPQNKDEKIVYSETGGGLQFSQYYNDLARNMGESTDCDGNPYYVTGPPYHLLRYNSYMGGASFSKTENLSKYNRFSYGLNAYFGADKGVGVDSSFSKTLSNIAVQPNFTASSRWIGVSVGLHLGSFHYADWTTEASSKNVGEMVGGPKPLYVFPSISLRIGPPDIFYIEPFMASYFPSASPLMLGGISVGSGLGKIDGTNFGIGYGTSGVFFKTMFAVKENLYLDGFLSFRPNSIENYRMENNSRFGLSVGLHHRFNYKTVPVTSGK